MPANVLTLIVTTADDADFRATFAAAAAQTYSHELVVVDASRNGALAHLTHRSQKVRIIPAHGSRNFGRAICEALTHPDVAQLRAQATHLWLLHADCQPEADALQELVDVIDNGPSIAIVGPKQLGPAGELYEVGITATRTGKRLETAAVGEVDQGQYDGRSDVLAVGSAGMLIEAAVWDEARGFDPVLGPFGDGLELCRRVRRLGYRVAVAPRARMVHLRRSLNHTPRSFAARRRSAIYLALMALPVWLAPLYALSLLVLQPLRSVLLLARWQPKRALGELAAWLTVVSDSLHLLIRRATARSKARIPKSALASLETSQRDLLQRRQWNAWRRERIGKVRMDSRYAEAFRVHRRRNLEAAAGLACLVGVFTLLVFAPMMWADGGSRFIAPAWADLPQRWSTFWFDAWGFPTNARVAHEPFLALLALLGAPFAFIGVSPTVLLQGLMYAAIPVSALAAWALASAVTPRAVLRVSAALLWIAQPAFVLSLGYGHIASVVVHACLPVVALSMLKMMGLARPWALAADTSTVLMQRRDRFSWWGPLGLSLAVVTAAMPAALLGWLVLLGAITIYATLRPKWRISPHSPVPVRMRLIALWLCVVPALALNSPYLWTLARQGRWAALAFPAGRTPSTWSYSELSLGRLDLLLSNPASAPLGVPALTSAHLWLIALSLPWLALLCFLCARPLHSLYQRVRGTRVAAVPRLKVLVALSVGSACLVALAGVARHVAVAPTHPHWHDLVPASVAAAQGASTTLPTAFDSWALTATQFVQAHHMSPPWTAPYFSAAAMLMLIYLVVAPPAQRHSVWAYRGLLTAGVLSVAAAMMARYAVIPSGQPLLPLNASNAYSLPASVQEVLKDHGTVVVVTPVDGALYVRQLRGNGPLLTDASPLTSATTAGMPMPAQQAQHDAELAGTLVTVIATPDEPSVTRLAALGVDSLVVPQLNTPDQQQIERALDRAPGVEKGASTTAVQTWRIRPNEQLTSIPEIGAQAGDQAQSHGQWRHYALDPFEKLVSPGQEESTGDLLKRAWPWVTTLGILIALLGCMPRRIRRPLTVIDSASEQGGSDG